MKRHGLLATNQDSAASNAAGHTNVSIALTYVQAAVDDGVLVVIEPWIGMRSALDNDARHRLFCTLKGKSFQTAYVRALLPCLARRAGVA